MEVDVETRLLREIKGEMNVFLLQLVILPVLVLWLDVWCRAKG